MEKVDLAGKRTELHRDKLILGAFGEDSNDEQAKESGSKREITTLRKRLSVLKP